jgi:hypothetical protein
VGPLTVPHGAEEYSWESAETHGICDCRVIVSLDVRDKGCNVVLGEVELAAKDNFAGGVNF